MHCCTSHDAGARNRRQSLVPRTPSNGKSGLFHRGGHQLAVVCLYECGVGVRFFSFQRKAYIELEVET